MNNIHPKLSEGYDYVKTFDTNIIVAERKLIVSEKRLYTAKADLETRHIIIYKKEVF